MRRQARRGEAGPPVNAVRRRDYPALMGVGVSPRRGASRTGVNADPVGGQQRTDSPVVILAVAGVLALGVALRFVTQSDLWADEVLSVNIARLPFGQIPEALRHDGAPPLYYFLLHGWMKIFGTGNASVRAMSGLVGVATFVPMWCAGRRLDVRRVRMGTAPDGSRVVAWSALLLLAMSPFAIRYSTETRMYALVILGVVLGYLAVARALERATLGRLAIVALVTGLLLLTHYWALPLLTVTIALLGYWALWGDTERRRAAWRILVALGVGSLAFVPWLSSFLFQLEHTGTPWGATASPFGSWATAFKSFGGNAHLAGWILVMLVLLGLFAAAVDGRHFSVDMATRPGVRLEAAIAVATIAVGLVVARTSGTTFEGRYASVAFPLFVLVGAFGLTVFADPRIRVMVLAGALVLGAWGGVSNAQRNRTQAYQLVPIIRDGAAPGDVVLFCPDAIGTDVVGRLRSDVRSVSFPSLTSPERVDWVDYEERVRAIRPRVFVERVLRMAGANAIWFVYTNNDTIADQQCAKVADFLTLHRPGRVRELEPDPYFFEHHGLYRYPVPA